MANMMLSGKVVVLTSAASKMGEAIARMFVDHGARVILIDINRHSCDSIVAAINKTKNDTVAHAMACDVSNPSNILAAVQEAKKFYSQDIDIFYNVSSFSSSTEVMNIKDTKAANVESVIASINHAGDVMRRNGRGGCIMCTGSTVGNLGDAVPSSYSISKAATIDVVRTATAVELRSHGVQMNAISPLDVAARSDKSVLKQILPLANDQQLNEMIRSYGTNKVSKDDMASNAGKKSMAKTSCSMASSHSRL